MELIGTWIGAFLLGTLFGIVFRSLLVKLFNIGVKKLDKNIDHLNK